jgi:hypothetical protein
MAKAYKVAVDYSGRHLHIQHLDLPAVMSSKQRDHVALSLADEQPSPLRFPLDIE